MRSIPLVLACQILLVGVGCKKGDSTVDIPQQDTTNNHNTTNNQPASITLLALRDSICNSYSTTRICRQGSNNSGYLYDTTYNAGLTISAVTGSNDILILGYRLSFAGDTATKFYHYYLSASGGGQHFFIDSNLHSFTFSYWEGGLGGGHGCNYNGMR